MGSTPSESDIGSSTIVLRRPRADDARTIWSLVKGSGSLDLNSPYAYLLLCTDFAATSVVAERNGAVVGFVGAYRPPDRPASVFVWQILVVDGGRGCGLGGRLLQAVLAAPGSVGVRYLEATVTPSNGASRALFESFARRRGADFDTTIAFAADLFPDSHEPEVGIRIGPLAV